MEASFAKLKCKNKRESNWLKKFLAVKNKKPEKAKQCFQKQDNVLVYLCRFCLETYLLLDGLPPGITSPTCPHAIGSTGLHGTSIKNDPDLTTYIKYITDSTETIKLATLLSTTIWTF